MEDENKMTAMKFLQILALYAYLGKQQSLPSLIVQMLQLTLLHGICKESCYGMASFSFLLCHFDDFKAADHIG
eukprot:2058765-Ditylum_brightwellii.AAC.1